MKEEREKRESKTLTRMKEKVIFEVGLFGKSTITNGTFEGPPSIVNVGMCFQVSRCWEWFPAQITLVRFVLKSKRRKVNERERKREKEKERKRKKAKKWIQVFRKWNIYGGKSKDEMWQRASSHLSLLSHQFITASKHKSLLTNTSLFWHLPLCVSSGGNTDLRMLWIVYHTWDTRVVFPLWEMKWWYKCLDKMKRQENREKQNQKKQKKRNAIDSIQKRLTTVNPSMSVEWAACTESFATDITDVRFFSCVKICVISVSN